MLFCFTYDRRHFISPHLGLPKRGGCDTPNYGSKGFLLGYSSPTKSGRLPMKCCVRT